MYTYLYHHWIDPERGALRSWLAALGGLLYLLHLLTLQQILPLRLSSLPFSLLGCRGYYYCCIASPIHFRSRICFYLRSYKLLLAPSGTHPTLFYLAALFSVGYAFFLKLPWGELSSYLRAAGFGVFIGLFTFFMNSYWIIPNFYYSYEHSHYVVESRENELFGPESLWSIRDAATVSNFLSGRHYLMQWKDYDFAAGEFELIFEEWHQHLDTPMVEIIIHSIGLIALAGLLILPFRNQRGNLRWYILTATLVISTFLYIDLFPIRPLYEWLYSHDSFVEAFAILSPSYRYSTVSCS